MTGLLLPATVLLSTTLLFTTHRSYAGLDRGNSSPASLMLQRAGASPATPAAGPAFEKTYWKATELVGKPVPPASRNREAHLVFEQDGRMAGADGCNRITGTYRTNRRGDQVRSIGQHPDGLRGHRRNRARVSRGTAENGPLENRRK